MENKWISVDVNERLPNRNKLYFVFVDFNGKPLQQLAEFDTGTHEFIGSLGNAKVTHWLEEKTIENDWIEIKEDCELPEKIDGWEHSKQVLLWYSGNQSNVEAYGIGYYNYNPPFEKAGFIDFAHYGRKPNYWAHLIEPPKQ